MQLNSKQKDLVDEHRTLIANFGDDKHTAERIEEIEKILEMSTEELAQLALDAYSKQY